MNTVLKTRSHMNGQFAPSGFRVLEEAREAVTKLRVLKPFLSPQDEETLAILMDKELMHQLDESVREAEEGILEPLQAILE